MGLTEQEKRHILEVTNDYSPYRYGYVDAHGHRHL